MAPTIRPGDEVVVERCDGDSIAVGDVVLALRDGEPVVHRVIDRRGAAFLLKGDLSLRSDPGDLRLVGRVVEVRGRRVRRGPSHRLLAAAGRFVVRNPRIARSVLRLVSRLPAARRVVLGRHV